MRGQDFESPCRGSILLCIVLCHALWLFLVSQLVGHYLRAEMRKDTYRCEIWGVWDFCRSPGHCSKCTGKERAASTTVPWFTCMELGWNSSHYLNLLTPTLVPNCRTITASVRKRQSADRCSRNGTRQSDPRSEYLCLLPCHTCMSGDNCWDQGSYPKLSHCHLGAANPQVPLPGSCDPMDMLHIQFKMPYKQATKIFNTIWGISLWLVCYFMVA